MLRDLKRSLKSLKSLKWKW